MNVDTPALLDTTTGRVTSWAPYVLFNAGTDTPESGLGPGMANQSFFVEPKVVPITFDATGYPVLAIAIGSGNRDNVFFPNTVPNRFYVVVDRNDGATVTEGDLQAVAVDAPDTTSNYLNDPDLRGWYLVLGDQSEKVNTTALVVNQYVIFSTFAPSEVEVYPPDSGLCRIRGHAKTYLVDLWSANAVGDGRFVEHTGDSEHPPVLATDPVLYTGADGEIHILQSLDDLQLTKPLESWSIPLRVFSWKED